MKRSKFTIILLKCLILIGCSTTPERKDVIENSINDTIAMNFVYVISQVPSLHPDRNTFRSGSQKTEFDQSFVNRLADAGYAIKRSERPGYSRTYSYNTVYSAAGLLKITVNIDNYRFSRTYQTRSGVADPVTPMFVQGTRNSAVDYKINDYVFPRRVSEGISKVQVEIPAAQKGNIVTVDNPDKLTSQWFYHDVQKVIPADRNVSILNGIFR